MNKYKLLYYVDDVCRIKSISNLSDHLRYISKYVTPRSNGEANVEIYYSNRNCHSKMWYVNRKLHNTDDKPEQIVYNIYGIKERVDWIVNGQRHRGSGNPAVVYYNQDGAISGGIYIIRDDTALYKGDDPEIINMNSFIDRSKELTEYELKNTLLLNIKHRNLFISTYCKYKLGIEDECSN